MYYFISENIIWNLKVLQQCLFYIFQGQNILMVYLLYKTVESFYGGPMFVDFIGHPYPPIYIPQKLVSV